MDITTKLYEEAMAGPVASRPFGDDQTAGFDALVVGVLFVFFVLKFLNVLNVLKFAGGLF